MKVINPVYDKVKANYFANDKPISDDTLIMIESLAICFDFLVNKLDEIKETIVAVEIINPSDLTK